MKELRVFSVLTACLSLAFMALCFGLASCDDGGGGPGIAPPGGEVTGGGGGSGGGNDGGGGGSNGGSLTTTVTSEGTVLRGANLASKLAWLDRSAESHNTYIVEVGANENIAPYTLEYTGAINITVILRGDGTNRTIRLSKNGTMFTVRSQVTFVLDNNITLQGHSTNTDSMVHVRDGIFRMNAGSTITGNTSTAVYGSGGVTVWSSGTFEMNGGTIIGNTNHRNDFDEGGGGVLVVGGTFTMRGGTISGNTAFKGGGVFVGGTFTMSGGTISGNTATEYGGGVYSWRTFTKRGGTITGYNSDQSNGNVVRDNFGNTIARRGHAVYISSDRRKETTAGPNVDLSNSDSGGWDD